jgi:hypothetical protein
MGMTRPTLLHETAHVLTAGDGHGPDFCRVALSLRIPLKVNADSTPS